MAYYSQAWTKKVLHYVQTVYERCCPRLCFGSCGRKQRTQYGESSMQTITVCNPIQRPRKKAARTHGLVQTELRGLGKGLEEGFKEGLERNNVEFVTPRKLTM
jgi:hypothetical protein